MTKKWIFINVFLLLIAGIVAWQLHVAVRHFEEQNDLAKIQPVRDMKQQLAQEAILPPLDRPQPYFPAEFSIIPESNIFSDTRGRDEEESEEPAVAQAPMLTQKPILVGIHISGEQRMASIIDPQSSGRNQSRRSETKRIGDVYRGYTITDINPDHIVLASGGRSEVIPLHEGSKQPQGGKTPILSTRIVSFGDGTASGGSPVKVSTTSARTTRTTAPSAAARTQAAAKRQEQPARQATTARITPTPAETPPPARQTRPQQQAPSTGAGSPETEIIRTPFGNIVRPVRR